MDVSLQEFRDIQSLVHRLCGLVLADDKTYLVRHRLEPVARSHGCTKFSDYLRRVQHFDSILLRDELVEALTTGETSFNRDGHPFEEFRRRILPTLAATIRQGYQALPPVTHARIWSAGCSTGQEAYSLAIAVYEFLATNSQFEVRPEQFPILATDISNSSLNAARAGRFSQRDVERGLSTEHRKRYFHQLGDVWTADNELQHLIDFRRLNLMDRLPGLGPFQVIFCRNVLIYFDTTSRQRLCDQFHQLLAPSGLLILGAAENLLGISTPFTSQSIGRTTVYRAERRVEAPSNS